jgi:uncharacterized protein (DUF302 family)
MNFIKSTVFVGGILALTACGENTEPEVVVEDKPITILQKVDNAVVELSDQISDYSVVTTLDHHRMAKDAGVYTPPSIATIFSNPLVEAPLLQESQLIGLDLPFKVLCYAEPDTANASLAYTSSEFIQKRHNLDPTLMDDYDRNMSKAIKSFPKEMVSMTDVTNVEDGFGIVMIKSDFNYTNTVQNLRDIIMAQGDTKWFADVDYQEQASIVGVELRPTILLLFGGPAPGGKAMMTSPKIGLDAFCQKLLVYENEDGEVWIAYNDIVAFAELYYQTSTKPQQMINQRLKMTFTKAVTESSEES